MQNTDWDCVIIGGSVAGLSAAQVLGRARRRTLVIDAGAPRNRFTDHMHGVLGHDGIDPAQLLERGRAEVRAYGVQLRQARVSDVRDDGDALTVRLDDGEGLSTRTILIATGVVDRLPDISGIAERWGRDVLHCPYCHGFEVADRRLGVIATSAASIHQIELARQWSAHVTAFTALAGDIDEAVSARLTARDITIVEAPVVALSVTDDAVAAVITSDGEQHPVDAVFTAPRSELTLDFAGSLALARSDTPGAPLAVDATGATSHPRVWAAGNVVAPFGNVPLSMGSGSMAGAGVNASLVADDAARAVAQRQAERNRTWESKYAEQTRIWSGRVNATTAAIVQTLTPGTALDVGCGEGADAVWLAQRGWIVTGVDVSATAVLRATDAAREHGLGERTRFMTMDAVQSLPDATYDLVTASFLHSWEKDFPRLGVLRAAADRVAAGGRMLVVSHAAPPPWARALPPHMPPMRKPLEELSLLDLPPDEWVIEIAETRERATHDPDGNPAICEDGVLLLQRR